MIWVAAGLIIAVAVLELVHRFVKPLPWWQKIRKPVAVGVSVLVGLLTLRALRRPKLDPAKLGEIKPTEFDDAPERELDRKADDLDLGTNAGERDLADVRESNESLRERLARIKGVQGGPDGSD